MPSSSRHFFSFQIFFLRMRSDLFLKMLGQALNFFFQIFFPKCVAPLFGVLLYKVTILKRSFLALVLLDGHTVLQGKPGVLICKMLQKMQNKHQTATKNGGFCGFLYLTTPKCKSKLL